ncbi:mesoderm induction early response protein 1 isoform X2 [Copidosoma floridanum]|nr:mesoderm induction early response protein 1 isoform X2 [Copidosoma floridanum]XP_023246643.1 mesoderm induction early response protein 1 isoform X2 [Copidosoma floridanum]
MPLKDLLVMYGYSNMDCQDPNKAEDEDEEEEEEEEEDEEEEEEEDEDDEDPTSYEPDLKQFYTEMVKAGDTGGNIKRATMKAGDPARTDDPQVLAPNDNAHTTTNSVESKAEENSGVISIGTSENPSTDSQNPSRAVDGNPNAASTTPGTNTSGGGGGGNSSRLLRSVSRPQSEEEEEDGDYTPDEEEWKKTIMVGSDYQAAIPEGLCKYDDALPYENEDKMLWDPLPISEEQIVEEFLERAQQPAVKGISLPRGNHVRDDEQALYLLLQCGYNLEEALRRRRMNVLPSTESISIWSEEECHNFETGIRSFGKDFYSIHKHKVRTRSVGELVQFYYLWKKTERHDIFTYKARMEKKKYAFHPGVTDYMDRFLEEQEGVRDRSSSPNVNYLMHTDKRQRIAANSMGNEETSSGKLNHENWEIDNTNPNGGNKASHDNWNASANSSAATAGSTTPNMPISGSSNTEEPTSVNSEHVDSFSHDHLHNSSTSTVTAASQLDYTKVNDSAGVESNASCAAVTPWPSSNTSTNMTIAPLSSSSNSAAAAPMLHQQQQSNHLLHMQQQQQLMNLPLNKSNENDATLPKARTPESILPHLPP